MKRRTKIVCTLGPATGTKEKIEQLIAAGMNVARLNCSHGDWKTKAELAAWVRELSSPLGPVAVMADLQGPKFRLDELEGGIIDVETGSHILIGPDAPATLRCSQKEILNEFSADDRVLLGDGNVELKLGKKCGENFEAEVKSGGQVKSRQGVTLVGKVFDVPSMTDKDRADIEEAAKVGVDYIALSYVRSVADIRELRREVDKYDKTIRLCAKIETREGLKNIEEILKVADIIMVARGDMGLQMDIEEVPLAQKHIIELCSCAGKPVITATQMLESMMSSPRPTRAEATDVANAILDGTDAVMLSGETAAGLYPIECVKMMVKIAEKAETAYDRGKVETRFQRQHNGVLQTEAVAHGAAALAERIHAQAIITTSTSGQTARFVSKFRPPMPILCATYTPRSQAQMAVVWGVETILIELVPTIDEAVAIGIDAFCRLKQLNVDDMVVITAGVPMGAPGHTNLIMAQVVK